MARLLANERVSRDFVLMFRFGNHTVTIAIKNGEHFLFYCGLHCLSLLMAAHVFATLWMSRSIWA